MCCFQVLIDGLSLHFQGTHERLRLYLLCDSYQGADRETKLPTLEVAEGDESDEDESDEEEDEGTEEEDGDTKMEDA
jgi:pre-mRNA-splicing helicase BRR2